jgi:hypothetical protein
MPDVTRHTPAQAEAKGARALARTVATRRRLARQGPAPAPGVSPPQPPPPLLPLFDRPSSQTAAGVRPALDEYRKLSPALRKAELAKSSRKGIRRTLAALGDKPALESTYADLVLEILGWVEATETRELAGKTEAEMAKVQATFLEEIKQRWDPSLHAALLRGYYQRLLADPTVKGKSMFEFEALVVKVFGAALAAQMAK